MPITKSISGIRGTIGEKQGEDLTTNDIRSFTAAYAALITSDSNNKKIVIGRDARISGLKIKNIVIEVLNKMGLTVIDLDLATTPTVELAVIMEKAQGGIIITASHNPQEWNALKMLNKAGEFLSAEDMKKVIAAADKHDFKVLVQEKQGEIMANTSYLSKHIDRILSLKLVDAEKIKKANFRVLVDGINSVGGVAVPELLKRLGVNNIIEVNCYPTGNFSHNPEPLEKNLGDIMKRVKTTEVDLGIIVDPDVDRLGFIDEKGQMFGEENTLVAVADYVLQNYKFGNKYKKNSVSNLSSSRALRDITEKYDGEYFATAIGEINVVEKMKEVQAVIGGEGNGGVIYPELHYGRDALVGIALFLSYLARRNDKVSKIKKELPRYYMIKDSLELKPDIDLNGLFDFLQKEYQSEVVTRIDGLKIDYPEAWVHLRASNTEPIIRLYAEAKNLSELKAKVDEIKEKIAAKLSENIVVDSEL